MFLQVLKDLVFPLTALILSIVALYKSSRAAIASKRPHLVFVDLIITEDGATKTGFYLSNLGLGPAFNIDIPNEYLEKYPFLSAFRDMPRNLAPEGKTLFALHDGKSKFITSDIYIQVIYEDHEGRVYKTHLTNMRHSFQ